MKYDFLSIGGMTEDLVFFTDEGILLDNKDDILRQKLLAFEYGAKINSQNLFLILAVERLILLLTLPA